ncbi:SDR family NAD(P)-dependent oxidoreductase [Novosphingobium pentaromativorans]|uniref:Short-chain dehydrogenase/reductase SDR n=1 Tax=Novosphingobium pentaromativorans US6-1 TaxID=1088721 RepID=G6EAZ8_9SPHN|nr:SDR family oxidoreductase [Novosphingobium pentaromativorans]AIT80551.1 oxidoreductase [Novosphingobium pentaromativorans US6-1]EHJ61465.1 hypothetical protein NSU_1519 [Novosphingobium pentaromativorans US6-1]
MQDLLKDKCVVITGAGAGVGRAATMLFGAEGARIVVADIDVKGAEDTVAMAKDKGIEAVAIACDVTKHEDVEAAIALAVSEFGRLDVMYNNAGVATKANADGQASSFMDGSFDELMRIMAINAGGVANGCRAAIAQFRKQGGGGVIVNTSSLAGITAFGGPDYGATKGAVSILTRSLAMQVAGEGIRVNAVCPAAMPTNFGVGADAWSDKAREFAAKLHPLGKLIEADDCANAALFLASDMAANVTGVNLPVDGGLAAGVKMGG